MILDALKNSVKKQDIGEIKSIFFTIFSRRPTPEKINENLKYCFENGIDKNKLFMAHDGEILDDFVKNWDNDYYSNQVGKLRNNFSKERITHLIKMADFLFGEENKKKAENKANKESMQNKKDNTFIYIAVGTVAALIALVFASI